MSTVLARLAGLPGGVDIGRASPSWVVCGGKTRDVIAGLVCCPRQGSVNADVCSECHFLLTLARERDPRLACSTAE